MQPSTRDYIIKSLADMTARNEIIYQVCEREGCKWSQAETYVDEVAELHAEAIGKRSQSTLRLITVSMLFGSVVILMGGLLTILFQINIFFLRLPIPYLGNALILGTGILMLIGVMSGMLFKSE